jgi:hypothetical protein
MYLLADKLMYRISGKKPAASARNEMQQRSNSPKALA